MANYAQGVQASDLTLVEPEVPPADSAQEGEVSPAAAERKTGASPTDRFLAEAQRELEAGEIDQPIWARAVVQAGGDEKLATSAYLRARAAALQLEKRTRRAVRLARRERAISVANGALNGKPGSMGARKLGFTGLTVTQVAWLVGALSLLLVAAALVAFSPWADQPQSSSVGKGETPAPSTATVQAGNAAAAGHGDSASAAEPHENYPEKVSAFRDAGNWNLVVLYAAEWTRKQPDNVEAWKALSSGYLRMRQFNDAFGAARKATELAPSDASVWRNAGQIHLALNDPPAALAAFQKAIDLNNEDVSSLVQVAVLYMQLGNLPGSRSAIARGLAVAPDDVDALCVAASLAQRDGRPKEAEALNLRASSSGTKCRDLTPSDTASVRVSAPSSSSPTAPRR